MALSEVPGDSQFAKQLQAKMEEEENVRRLQAEKSDYDLAKRLSLESRAPLNPIHNVQGQQKREREKPSGGDIRQMFQKQAAAKKRVVVVDLSLDDDDDDEDKEREEKVF